MPVAEFWKIDLPNKLLLKLVVCGWIDWREQIVAWYLDIVDMFSGMNNELSAFADTQLKVDKGPVAGIVFLESYISSEL